MGKKKKNDIVGKIPKGVWLLISLAVALIVWTLVLWQEHGKSFPKCDCRRPVHWNDD